MNPLMDVLLSGVFATNPKKYAWVSEVEAGPYHLETDSSAANGGNTFVALCGVRGDFNCHFTAAQIIARLKCQECRQLSTANILDVADHTITTAQGLAQDGVTVGDHGGCPELGDREGSRPWGATGTEKPPHQVQILTAVESLPVPLGREVSGEQRSHCENMVEGVRPFATVPVQFESGYCNGSPADQILPRSSAQGREGATASTSLDVAPEHRGTTIENLVDTVDKVTLKQRIDFEMRLNRKLPGQGDPIHDSNGRW